jgi:hypothetical protein
MAKVTLSRDMMTEECYAGGIDVTGYLSMQPGTPALGVVAGNMMMALNRVGRRCLISTEGNSSFPVSNLIK